MMVLMQPLHRVAKRLRRECRHAMLQQQARQGNETSGADSINPIT